MITNEKQYKITNARVSDFSDALNLLIESQDTNTGLAKVQRQAIESQLEELKKEISDYELLKSGEIKHTEVTNLEDLPEILIKSRIAQRMTQADLAEKLGFKTQQIQRYEAEKYATASFTRLLEVANALKVRLKGNARFLLGASDTEFWTEFPIKEMYDRGWFESFSGSARDAKNNAEELITDFFVSAGLKYASASSHHKKRIRAGSALNEKALWAWQARIIQKSFFSPLSNQFDMDRLNAQWIKSLLHLSVYPDGPLRAKEYLANAGIHLIVERHLPSTHLDGAAMRGADDAPIIAMTLRFDRTDNFWFVLMHELAHVIKHLYASPDEGFFDDLDSDAHADPKEIEADEFAQEALIPSQIWAISPARFFANEETIKAEAEKLGISEAIIAGRVRLEKKDWTSPALLRLVGQNQVRHLFEV